MDLAHLLDSRQLLFGEAPSNRTRRFGGPYRKRWSWRARKPGRCMGSGRTRLEPMQLDIIGQRVSAADCGRRGFGGNRNSRSPIVILVGCGAARGCAGSK